MRHPANGASAISDGKLSPGKPDRGGPAPDRLHLLTFFRFAAALWILLFHLESRLVLDPGWPLAVLIRNGAYAMSFFFVLSGAVLAYGYHDLAIRENGVARFYLARFARVYPAYAVTHLVCLPWLAIAFPGEWMRWLFVNLTSALGIQAWFPHTYVGANAGTWSISCEFYFYALFPALLPLAQRLAAPANFPRTVIYLALAIGFVGLADFVFAGEGTFPLYYISPALRLPEFFLGAVLGAALRRRSMAQSTSIWTVVAAAAAVGITSLNTAHHVGLWTRANVIVVPAIAWLIFAAGAYEHGQAARMRNGIWGLPRYLGEVSYCFFLAQLPLLMWFNSAKAAGHPLVAWAIASPRAGTMIFILAVLMASVALHEGVEKPIRRVLLRRPWGTSRKPAMPAPSGG